VTRCACDKITQNEAQPIFVQQIMQNYLRGKKYSNYLGYFCNLKKYPEENKGPTGQYSSNLVTLLFHPN
jgi:hypothetical protein